MGSGSLTSPVYTHDVFLSYTACAPVGPWVRDAFYPKLKEWLTASLPKAPKIFIDREIEVGAAWPKKLEEALIQSKVMVCIWAPPYFGSKWCMAEWKTMRRLAEISRRELGTDAPNGGLVYPIRFFDGDSFPQEARKVEHNTKFMNFTALTPRQLLVSKGFVTEVQQVADTLSRWINKAPQPSPNWKAVRPRPIRQVNLSFDQVRL